MNHLNLTKDTLLFGAIGEPKYRKDFHAGTVKVILEDGMLRNIFVGKTEILRGIYVAVRDRNWNTINPRFYNEDFQQYEDSFVIRFSAEHKNEEIEFVWEAIIRGSADGAIQFQMDGVVNKEFFKNRIGFCILHPMELAGKRVTVINSNGTEQGIFPNEISPHQPFINILGMNYGIDGYEIRLNLEGDIFEMEDQRNWTDASYKTYCTPLSLPFPVKMEKGQKVSQLVELHIENLQHVIQVEPPNHNVIKVTDLEMKHFPGFGLVDPANALLTGDELLLLQKLRLDHLRGVIDLANKEWREKLKNLVWNAASLNTKIDLEVVVDEIDTLKEFQDELVKIAIPIKRMFFFDKQKSVTTKTIIDAVKQLRLSNSIQIGGGSRAFFAELNRLQMPLEELDVLTYSINPQVHAFDNYSLIETLKAQPTTVQTARKIENAKPIVVGPITFKMRFNPNATDQNDISALDDSDPRQMSLFGAAWTLGSIKSLSSSEVESLTYFNTIGPSGLMSNGLIYPLYHVFADISQYLDGNILETIVADNSQVVAFAMKKNETIRLLIANISNQDKNVEIKWPWEGLWSMRILDETNIERALYNPSLFREEVIEIRDGDNKTIKLRPYALGCIDYEMRRID